MISLPFSVKLSFLAGFQSNAAGKSAEIVFDVCFEWVLQVLRIDASLPVHLMCVFYVAVL